MQTTNRIFFHNSHIHYHESHLLPRPGPDGTPRTLGWGEKNLPISELFRGTDWHAAQFLEPRAQVWIPIHPHGGKQCVCGYKRVVVVSVSATQDLIKVEYQTFDARPRHPSDVALVRAGQNGFTLFTLNEEDEGRLEFLAQDYRAIFIGRCDDDHE